jgi:tRNA dimethylallyltransferase
MAGAGSGHGGCAVAVVGPTATGKSELAILLAEQLNGEIISVDSMQVYRGLDIGTAKPSAPDRARVPHHLIDIVDINAEFNVARFVGLAQQSIQEIRQRGRVPVLCGGTGLYFKALFHGLGPAPARNAALRADLEKIPLPELLAELASCDPLTYQRIDRQNPRRVIRAVEVIRVTGKAYSLQRADWSLQPEGAYEAVIFGITRNPADLQCRIDTRVGAMFNQGLVAETKKLLEAGLANNPTALQALGYRQVVDYLRGVRSLSETIALVKLRTRQFAKRQMTWFRRQLPVQWIKAEAADAPAQIIAQLSADLPEPLRSKLLR